MDHQTPSGTGHRPEMSATPSTATGSPDFPTTPDPVEIALDAAQSGKSPSDIALDLLERQARLISEQTGLARNERFRNRIKAVRDAALSALVLAIVGAVALVLWNARHASGLVVEAFQTPPQIAATGLDGAVVAARLLDRLSAMQAATDSSRAPATFSNNWGKDLAVEVPQTGMSAGEVWRMLRQALGKETRLSGDLTEADGRLTLTTRVGSNAGVVFSGGPNDLDALLDQTARAVYRQAQPYRYSVWLGRVEQADSTQILTELAGSGGPEDRLWGLVGLSVNALDTDPELARSLAQDALALDPSFHKARWNVSDALAFLGHDEADLQQNRIIERTLRQLDRRVTPAAQGQMLYRSRVEMARYLADWRTVVDHLRTQSTLPDYSQNGRAARYEVARALVALHDGPGARHALALADRIGPMPEVASRITPLVAQERGDVLGAATQVRAHLAAHPQAPKDWLPQHRAEVAMILARAGDPAGAEALLTGLPADCHPCVIARGQMAALTGDTAQAERLLVQATHLGPSLPAAWQALGRVRLDRNDRSGAMQAFEEAGKRGPRWADPLKFQGDILLAQGNPRGAIRRYREAADRAPQWGALHLAWGRALQATGRERAAAEKYRQALGMDLSAADRADLSRRIT